MFVKRRINGEKLAAARVAAGFPSLNSFMKMLEGLAAGQHTRPLLSAPTYTRWEKGLGKQGQRIVVDEFDYNVLHAVCAHFNTTPEAVTDPVSADYVLSAPTEVLA